MRAAAAASEGPSGRAVRRCGSRSPTGPPVSTTWSAAPPRSWPRRAKRRAAARHHDRTRRRRSRLARARLIRHAGPRMLALRNDAGAVKVLGVVAVCVCALAIAPRADASWGFELGIGEQGIEMFSDPRFGALGLEHVRLVAPYDVACRP